MRTPSKALSLVVSLVLALGVALVDQPATTAKTVTTNARQAFITKVAGAAQAAQRSYGVPASVSIAQAIMATTWGTTSVVSKTRNYFKTTCNASMTPAGFASLADAQVGKPYVLGAEAAITTIDPPKFDCSELVEWLYGRSGNRITDLAAAQYDVTKKVTGSPKVGDLVFLRNNPARANGIGHVAVVTKKLANGDWRIIEARSHAAGVVRTTLSYWRQRSYYAGLRRYSSFRLADGKTVTVSAASVYQSTCVTVGGTKYAAYASIADSFAAHAAAVATDAKYAPARRVISDVPSYVTAIAKIERPKDAAAYATRLNQIINGYGLRNYDVVPFDLVLLSGHSGAKVKAAQYLLTTAGYKVTASSSYDKATIAAVKKYQKSRRLEVDGEAGPITLGSLTPKLASGASGTAVSALTTLLAVNGYGSVTSSFGSATKKAVSDFQAVAGRPVTGSVNASTWAALFMTLDAPTPKLSGKAQVGQQLTATAGSWPSGTTLSYQWYRAGVPISGATSTRYTVTVADAGSALTVRVRGIKRFHPTTVRTSAATATVPYLKLTATPVPTLSGTARIGSTLTAKIGTWSPKPVALAYQWYRNGVAIKGATGTTHKVVTADGGKRLTVSVTGSRLGYTTVTRTSAATASVPKLLTSAAPTITGSAKVGSTLTAKPGSWSPTKVALSYHWYRDGKAIDGATAATHKLVVDDLGARLTVRVTGRLTGYVTASRTSAASAVVAKGSLQAGKPTISGTRKSGKTLTAKPGTWGPGTVKLSYQWYRGSTAISGATEDRYKLTSKDKGAKVTVAVTGRKSGYTSVTVKAGAVTIAK